MTSAQGETVPVRVDPVFRSDNSLLTGEAISAGLGIGLMHKLLLDPLAEAGKLEYVLPDWRYEPQHIHAVYPSNRYIPLKVRIFVDGLAELSARARRRNFPRREHADRIGIAAKVRQARATARSRRASTYVQKYVIDQAHYNPQGPCSCGPKFWDTLSPAKKRSNRSDANAPRDKHKIGGA